MAKIDIQKFKRRAYRKKAGLAKFLKKLGNSKIKGLTKTVVEIDKQVWQEVGCLDCANCCKKMTPTYTRKDVVRISKHLGMSYQQFFDKWLEKRKDGDITNKSNPCQFLGKDNKCSIYEIRPDDCAGFPHIVRKDFKYQAKEKTFTNNLTHCPATLRFVEKLQEAVEADL